MKPAVTNKATDDSISALEKLMIKQNKIEEGHSLQSIENMVQVRKFRNTSRNYKVEDFSAFSNLDMILRNGTGNQANETDFSLLGDPRSRLRNVYI